jgi:catalase
MPRVPREIQLRQIEHFAKVDADYGRHVAAGLELQG